MRMCVCVLRGSETEMVKLNGKEREMIHNVKRRNVCVCVCVCVREKGGGENEAQSKSYASNDIYVRVEEEKKLCN